MSNYKKIHQTIINKINAGQSIGVDVIKSIIGLNENILNYWANEIEVVNLEDNIIIEMPILNLMILSNKQNSVNNDIIIFILNKLFENNISIDFKSANLQISKMKMPIAHYDIYSLLEVNEMNKEEFQINMNGIKYKIKHIFNINSFQNFVNFTYFNHKRQQTNKLYSPVFSIEEWNLNGLINFKLDYENLFYTFKNDGAFYEKINVNNEDSDWHQNLKIEFEISDGRISYIYKNSQDKFNMVINALIKNNGIKFKWDNEKITSILSNKNLSNNTVFNIIKNVGEIDNLTLSMIALCRKEILNDVSKINMENKLNIYTKIKEEDMKINNDDNLITQSQNAINELKNKFNDYLKLKNNIEILEKTTAFLTSEKGLEYLNENFEDQSIVKKIINNDLKKVSSQIEGLPKEMIEEMDLINRVDEQLNTINAGLEQVKNNFKEHISMQLTVLSKTLNKKYK